LLLSFRQIFFKSSSKWIIPILLISFNSLAFEKKQQVILLVPNDPRPGLYELEISHNSHKKIISKIILRHPPFKFIPPSSGKYFWRVRSKKNNKWGPFSEYKEIVRPVSKLDGPLMLYPQNGLKLNLRAKKNFITFKWKKPSNEIDYAILIFEAPDKKPVKTLPVVGKLTNIIFPMKSSHYWWQIVAKDREGKIISTEEKYKFTVRSLRPKSKTQIILRVDIAQSSSSYQQTIDDRSFSDIDQNSSFSGQNLRSSIEYWPKKWKNQNALAFGIDYTSLSSPEGRLTNREIIGEYGQSLIKNIRSKHQVFYGLHFSQIALESKEIEGHSFNLTYGSLRYYYQRLIGEKFSFDLSSEIMFLLQYKFETPALRLRPGFNYRVSKYWWLSAFAGFERSSSGPYYSEGGFNGNLDISMQHIRYGIGLKYNYY
jgi:hypothetical protein